jgi:two-component system, OmpR family, phosphate regulon sensor histidine kinase PhoR
MMRVDVSFKKLLIPSLWVMLVLTLVIPSWYAYTRLHDSMDAEVKEHLIQQLELVHSMAQREPFQDAAQLQKWLLEIAAPTGLRLTYVADNGQVLADSEIPFERIEDLEDYSGRPEIAQAMQKKLGFMVRFSKSLQREQVSVARSIRPKGEIPAGVLRVSGSATQLLDVLGRMWDVSLVIFVLAFFMATALGFTLVRKLSRSLGSIAQVVDAMRAGDHRQRVHFPPDHEFHLLAESINRLAESTGRQFLALTAQEQELQGVFNAMRDGVMVLDSRGKIRSVNRTLLEWLGQHRRVLGRRPLEVIISLELEKACERVLSLRADSENSPHELLTVIGGGRTFEVNIVQLENQAKKIGALAVFHDMSPLKKLEKVRQDFVANVSHELRTPLTSIKGYTETLLADPQMKPDVLSSFLEVILRNTNHMVKMVDDLLQLARIEAKRETFNPAEVNPCTALMAAWKTCLPVAQARQIALVNLMPEEGICISADYDQVVRIFRNLLENGVRYSPEGGTIRVAASIEGPTVTLGVSNDGPAIPKYHQERIFERFYRIDKDRSSDLGGTGLGLAICRHIMLNHGGLIWVQSPNPGDNKGATFYFTMMSAR